MVVVLLTLRSLDVCPAGRASGAIPAPIYVNVDPNGLSLFCPIRGTDALFPEEQTLSRANVESPALAFAVALSLNADFGWS